ncbi:hypothetical protein Gpo141_00000413 [Globisporangium polare]
MLASRRFRVALGCCVASALALVLADKEAAFDPQHIVLGKNGQVQDVDPSLYFHERAAKKKTSAARASVVRTELQHTQQYQLKTNGHAEKAGVGARSPKLSISRVSDVEAQPTKTVEAQLHTAATHGPTDPSDAKAAPQPHKKSKATKKKVEAAMRKAPGSTEKREPQQRRRTLMERRSLQAQESDDDEFAQAPAPSSPESLEQAVDVPEVLLTQVESVLPGVPGSILFAEMSCIFVGFIGYLVHSIPLWARFSRGQRWCLVVAFSAAMMYQLAALSWYLDWVSPEVMIGLSSLITRMISLGMVPITTTSFVGRAREACSDQPGSVAQQAQTQQQLANASHNNNNNNSSSRGSRHHRHPRARAS